MEHEQEDCERKAQASRLALEGWSRKRDQGLATRGLNVVELMAKRTATRPAELT